MHWFRNLGLSGRIMLILAGAGLAFLAMLLTNILDYRNRMVATAITDVETSSREAAEDFAHLLAKGRRVLDVLPAIPAVTNASPDCGRILREARADIRIENLIRFDADGRGQCGSFAGATQMDVAVRDFFQRARRAPGFVVSDTYESPDNGETVMMLARAIQRDAAFDGVIAATFSLDTAAGSTDLPKDLGGTISIVDDQGRILVEEAADGSVRTNPGRLKPELMTTVSRAPHGHTRLTTEAGEYIVGFADLRAPGTKLYAMVQVPEATVLAPTSARMIEDLGFGTVILVATMSAIFFTLRRQVVTPIRHLLTTTDRLAAGDYAASRQKRGHTAGELSRLGGRLDELADVLDARERELTTTTQQRQAVVDNLPQAVLVLDANQRVAAVNAAFIRDLDMPAELLRDGTHIEGFIRYSAERGDYGDMDADTAVTHWLAMMRERQPVDFDEIGPHGQSFAVQGRPLPDGGYLGVYSDITERKRLADTFAAFFENAARRELSFDERVATLLEIGRRHFGLPVGLVARIDGDDYEILYAAAGAGHTAPAPGTVLPLSDMYCALALEKDKVIAFEQASEQGFGNHRCYRRFGVEAYIGVPLYIDGELYGALNFHSGERAQRQLGESDQQVLRLLVQWLGAEMGRQQDFQELRTTQARLADEQAYLEAVIEATDEGIAPVDSNGTVVTANSAMARIFAADKQALVGSSLTQLFAPAERGTILAALHETQALSQVHDGAGRQIEASGLRADGKPFPADLYLAPMAIEDSELVLAVIRDASEAHQAEIIKNQFVSTVSHELRTPLTSIVGSLGLVRGGAAGELPPRAATLIDMAHRNASRLIGLVNDILDFERLRSGRIEVDPQSVDLGEQMEAARQNNAGYAEQAGCRLDVHLPDQPVTVQVDPDRLQQVFSNLISNAAKFSPEGEAVDVRAEKDAQNSTVTVTVRDHGGGIPDSVRDRLFQPFVQADPADNRKHQKGTGLGLAISRSILERMAGAIWVESEPGDTRFFVRLPIAEASGRA